MSLFTGNSATRNKSLHPGGCAECGLPFEHAKIVYDFTAISSSIELCPKCARLAACRILLDCIRLEKGEKEAAKFWKARRKAVYDKAEALLEPANWSTDINLHDYKT